MPCRLTFVSIIVLPTVFCILAMHAPSTAEACSFAALDEHQLDASEQQIDTSPPSPPVVASVDVLRNPSQGDGCGVHDSCDGTGQILIAITEASDDRTPLDRMGYRLRIAGGEHREGVVVPDGAVRADSSGSIRLLFNDDGQDLDIQLVVTAVDLAGNESDPVPLHVVDGDGGCRASGSTASSWWCVLAALGLCAWRRARRPGSGGS